MTPKRTFLSVVLAPLASIFLMVVGVSADSIAELHEANKTEERLDLDLVYRVFNDVILEHQTLDPALQKLQHVAEDSEVSDHTRVKASLSMAHLLWRYGHFDRAIEVADSAIGHLETTDGTLLKARLLDAQGKKGEAVEWYEKTLELTQQPEERQFIQIRLAMIDVQPTNVEALTNLAAVEDQEFKNRAALTLAVLGHPIKAIELYQPDPDSTYYFRQLLRLTEWAILAEQFELAQENAWLAYATAETRFDALYALTLVDESYRKADNLEALLEALKERENKDQDLVDLHIDLLSDFEEYDEAIALFQSMNANPEDLSTRYRLLQIYDVARRTNEMVAEYRRLIREEPHTVLWYSGLAAHFVSVAQPDEARNVWHILEENNSANIDILAHGGRYMSQMGFEDESMAMIERHRDTHGPNTTGQIFLFEAHLANGRYDEATAELDLLTASLPKNSGDLRTVADAYERLQRFDLALDIFVKVQESEEEELGYDDRMRLAWLESVAGNREEALRLWQDIWVKEDAPARRNFAEAQFLLLAAELNKLASIAIDIERKLNNQEANKNEINLLVRIYTQVGDAFTAREVIEEFATYADLPAIERLKQIGLVYLQLNEYDKYDQILRELVEIDEENRLEHIQNIVLNAVAYTVNEDAEDRLKDIFQWLEELRKYDENAVAGEFEASVLSMSGFTEEAIESYRLALVQQPENSDNMLLMGELLKESDRTEEAVAIFQYIAEHAKDDNEFVVAIDGILNMIGQQQFGQRLSFNRQNAFKWAHRIILERITQKEDKFYLYTLLGEIATEFLDVESEFIAIENSISQAGIRRLSVLRELVTMSTPGQGFYFYGRSVNDPDRQITYGRRLIGLRQQLPPEVYISIAKTLLAQDDQLGAEKALDLIQDITGDLDVNQTKADLFQEAGFYKKALAFYNQALALNQNNLLLLIKTAVLREGNGQPEVAADLYMKGILSVLRSQPAQLYAGVPVSGTNTGWGGAQNTSVNRDYNTYYEPLIQGVIATWPQDPDRSAQQFALLREFFDAELEYIQTLPRRDDGFQITSYSRLDYFCRFVRRLSSVLEYYEFVDSLDLELAQVFHVDSEGEENSDSASAEAVKVQMGGFPLNVSTMMQGADNEQSFAQYLEGEYEANGLILSDKLKAKLAMKEEEVTVSANEDVDLLSQELENAIENKDVERTARLLEIVDSPRPVAQIFFDFLEESTGLEDSSTPMIPFDIRFGGAVNPREVLGYARSVLGEREYQQMVPVVSSRLRSEPLQLLAMLSSDYQFILVLEELVSPFFRNFSELQNALENPDASVIREGLRYGNFGMWEYIQAREDPNESIAFYEYLVNNLPRDSMPGQPHVRSFAEMYRQLVTLKLTGSQRRRVSESTLALVNTIDFQDEYIAQAVWDWVAIFDAHPDNLPLLTAVYDAVDDHLGEDWKLGEVLPAYYEGSRQDALKLLMEVEPSQYVSYRLNELIGTRFSDEIKNMVLSIVDGECIAEEQIMKLERVISYGFARYNLDGEEDYQTLRNNYNRALMRCFPSETRYGMELLMWSLRANNPSEARQLFREIYALDPTNESIRAAAFFWYKAREYYDDALVVATDGGPDLRSQEVITDIIGRNQDNLSTDNMAARVLYQVIPNELRPTSEFSGSQLDRYPKNITRAATRIAELGESASTTQAAEAVRLFWRNLNIQQLTNNDRFYMGGSNTAQFLEWPLDSEKINNVNFYGYAPYRSGNFTFSWSTYLNSANFQYGVQDDYVRLIDHTVKNYSLGRELELLLRAQSNPYNSNQFAFYYPGQTDEKSRWYEVIRVAYAHHPEDLQERLRELTDKILTGVAHEHEYMMWMHLTNESQTSPSAEVISNFRGWARAIKEPTQPQLLNVARFFAGLEEWEDAIDTYRLLVLNRADFNEFQDQRFYGYRNDQQLSISQILDDVIEWLPLAESRSFISDILPLVQRFDDQELGQFMTDTFNLEVVQRVFQPDEVFGLVREMRASTVLPDDRATSLRPFEAIPIMSGIDILIESGRFDKVLNTVEQLLTVENIASSSDTGDLSVDQSRYYGRQPELYALQDLAQNFSAILGITVPFKSPNPVSPKFASSAELLFALQDKLIDFGNSTWMDRLTDGLIVLIGKDSVEQQFVLELLAVLYHEFYKQELFETSSALASKLLPWLTDNAGMFSVENLSPFAYLISEKEFPVTPALFAQMMGHQFFSSEQQAVLIQKLRETADPDDVFLAIQQIPVETSGLTLLKELREVATQVNEETFVAVLNDRIEALESALNALEIRVL